MTLRELRKSLGLSQAQVAALAGYHRDTVARVEGGSRREPPDLRERLARGLVAQAALVRSTANDCRAG